MLEMMQALGLSLSHALPDKKLPALFAHGNCDLEREVLMRASGMWREGRFDYLVINGMTVKECQEQKINYTGLEKWTQWLITEGKVDPKAILSVRPGRHTYEEADAVHRLCQERGWNAVAFVSFPYHLLRCTLTHLAVLKRTNQIRAIFPVSIPAVNWFYPVTKQLLGAEKITKLRFEMFGEELERIQKYQAKGDCVSLEEMIEFFRKQDLSSI